MIQVDNQIDEVTTLPGGYTMRPATLDDAAGYAEVGNAVSQMLYGRDEANAEDIRNDWTNPELNLMHSSRMITTAEGEIVAGLVLWDTSEPPVAPWVNWQVHPDHRERGLGETLFQWVDTRVREVIARCPAHARVAYLAGTDKQDEAYRSRVMQSAGLQQVRRFYTMLIEMDEAPPAPKVAEGFSIRPMQYPDELEAVARTDTEGFRDHWGHVEEPFERVIKEWQHFVENDRLFDPSLWFLLIDDATGEIGGISLCRKESWDNPEWAYVDVLTVLKPYRRQGLALALLHHSFGEFWRRGQRAVSLGVDASSLTNAVALYERAGMHIQRQGAAYEKEIRPGENLMVTKLDT